MPDRRTIVREPDGGARTHALVAFWTVILVSLPLWWLSTSIERLSLPRLEPQVLAQLETLSFQREIVVDLLPGSPVARVRELELDIQAALDAHVGSTPVPGELVTVRASPEAASSEAFKLTVATPQSELFSFDYAPQLSPAQVADFVVELLPPADETQGPPPPDVASDSRVVPYAPHVHLRFTLLLEDVADPVATGSLDPTGWDIERALGQTLGPLVAGLRAVHAVSVSSQVQFHSPLAVAPFAAAASAAGDEGWVVGADDVKAFVNSEQWEVGAQVGNAGADDNDDEAERAELNFMLFVPKASCRPLGFEIEGADALAHSFLIPQVGSLVVYNPPPAGDSQTISASALRPILQQHAAHLRVLLGLPPSPSPLAAPSPADLSALARRRTTELVQGAVHTLGALDRLLAANDQMPVGPAVRSSVARAVASLRALASLSPAKPATALPLAVRASRRASQAFFEPSLMGLLYFPAEHKYAVYAPLFAPVGVPLLVAALKEAKRRRKVRSAPAAADAPRESPLANAAGERSTPEPIKIRTV